MQADSDHYEIYYADKLWKLLPAVYRSLDSDVFNSNGPLRELVNRIGAQAATLRRSIDRLWEDQSIESCDDWVISYIGDLLATNLVASLDARGQRLDVAKTIYYRRRKGTVAVLEEIASDITGWDVRIVEFFRRLGRTRHCFDPAIVDPAADPADDQTLQLAEELTGPWTDSKIGGWADLRNAYGASLAQSPFSVAISIRPPSAFDEYFHTADFRAGNGRSGWYNIPKLGVFLWRLMSFGVDQTTPVQSGSCYTFDPTGREVPLFAASTRPLGDTWVSAQEWQLPTPISTPLLRSALANAETQTLYAQLDPDGVTIRENSLGFFTKPGSFYELIDVSQVTTAPEATGASYALMVFPESGRFAQLEPLNSPMTVTYHYGFSAPMGAGPYDRRIVGGTPNPTPAPVLNIAGGGSGIAGLMQLPAIGTVSINDSLTYDAVVNADDIQQLTVIAQNQSRPLIRLSPPAGMGSTEWVFAGFNSGSLVLEGLFVSGGDIVLRGSFASVTLTCCTFDPGSRAEASSASAAVFAQSIDGRALVPARLWVESEIQQLNIDRSILGPVRMRSGGAVENLTITNSSVQSIPTSNSDLLAASDIKDPEGFTSRLSNGHDGLSAFLYQQLSPVTKSLMTGTSAPWQLGRQLANDLNVVIQGPSIYDPSRFVLVNLTTETQVLLGANPSGSQLMHLNRLLLEAAYPIELADLTLAFDNGTVNLSRCTLMGGAYVHRLEASESILGDVTTVENFQDGCVRFSAWSTGSVIPRQYESVQIPAGASLFTSQDFGQPGYAQLLDGADNEIVSGTGTILAGAQDGSEMGAFASQKNPIKERSILLKYQEFMPLGLSPVLIHVT
ncbi:MAG TPA: hypothetical protein VHT24_12755 [Pseudacidobacterium sp.]|nr:hypothetical protein [Pseudacidobacterium sp.]